MYDCDVVVDDVDVAVHVASIVVNHHCDMLSACLDTVHESVVVHVVHRHCL